MNGTPEIGACLLSVFTSVIASSKPRRKLLQEGKIFSLSLCTRVSLTVRESESEIALVRERELEMESEREGE